MLMLLLLEERERERERELEDMEGKAQNSIIYDVTSFDTATAR